MTAPLDAPALPRPRRRPVPCACEGCPKPAGVLVGTVLKWETRHGHPAELALEAWAAAAGYRLVPVGADGV